MGVEKRVEILIVGAGVIGASAAFALAKRGHGVLVVDRNSGVGDGSTGASAGIIRVHASDPQSSALAADSLELWKRWAEFVEADAGEAIARFEQCGTLLLDTGERPVRRTVNAMRDSGVAYEEWTIEQTGDRFPYLDLHRFGPPVSVEDEAFWNEPEEYLAGAVYTPQSGFVSDPTLAASNLMRAAQRRGAEYRPSAAVQTIDREGQQVIGATLADGTEIRAELVLLAMGPNTDSILQSIGGNEDFRIRTRRIREELLHVPVSSAIDVALQGVHLVDADLNINFRPESGNALLGGSNGDLAAEQTIIEDPDDFDRTVSPEAWERATLRLARRIPDLGIPRSRSGVVGLYDAAEDWLPIYDRTCYDGLFVAMATSGTQFKTAPLVGEMLAHIIENERNGIDHRTVPFENPFGERSFSTAQFSRLREPQSGQTRG